MNLPEFDCGFSRFFDTIFATGITRSAISVQLKKSFRPNVSQLVNLSMFCSISHINVNKYYGIQMCHVEMSNAFNIFGCVEFIVIVK